MIIFKLLEKWGVNGFISHTEKVAEFYLQRRDAMLKATDKWLTGENAITVFVSVFGLNHLSFFAITFHFPSD